jgi:hypothetical protein
MSGTRNAWVVLVGFRSLGFLATLLIAAAPAAHGEPLWKYETGG